MIREEVEVRRLRKTAKAIICLKSLSIGSQQMNFIFLEDIYLFVNHCGANINQTDFFEKSFHHYF